MIQSRLKGPPTSLNCVKQRHSSHGRPSQKGSLRPRSDSASVEDTECERRKPRQNSIYDQWQHWHKTGESSRQLSQWTAWGWGIAFNGYKEQPPWSIYILLLGQVPLRTLESFLPDMHVSDLNSMPNPDSRQVCGCHWKAPGMQLDQVIRSICTNCGVRNMWLRVCVEPSARSLATRRSTSQRSRALLFNAGEFEGMVAEK